MECVCVLVCVCGCVRERNCMTTYVCACVHLPGLCVHVHLDFHQMRNELSGPPLPPPVPRHILITSGLWYMDRLLCVKHIISLWKQAAWEIHQPASRSVWGSLHHTWASGLPAIIMEESSSCYLNTSPSWQRNDKSGVWLKEPDKHLFLLLSVKSRSSAS